MGVMLTTVFDTHCSSEVLDQLLLSWLYSLFAREYCSKSFSLNSRRSCRQYAPLGRDWCAVIEGIPASWECKVTGSTLPNGAHACFRFSLQLRTVPHSHCTHPLRHKV